VRYQFIADHEPEHRITAMCRALQVSKSGFYGWKRRPESGRAQANRHLLGDHSPLLARFPRTRVLW